jgi:Ca2+-binding RTX toxin-like protein
MVDDARVGTGNALDNRILGSVGDDKIYGLGGADRIAGGAGVDMIYGGEGDDELHGDAGADRLDGGEGNDKLIGGDGNDYLVGGNGSDHLEGGQGADVMLGGAGADRFNFRPEDMKPGMVDRIEDFSSAQGDRILLNLIDANANTASVNDKFAFIGTQAFGKIAGQLRYEVKGRDAYVSGDTNGDGLADFTIRLVGVTTLSSGDFML